MVGRQVGTSRTGGVSTSSYTVLERERESWERLHTIGGVVEVIEVIVLRVEQRPVDVRIGRRQTREELPPWGSEQPTGKRKEKSAVKGPVTTSTPSPKLFGFDNQPMGGLPSPQRHGAEIRSQDPRRKKKAAGVTGVTAHLLYPTPGMVWSGLDT